MSPTSSPRSGRDRPRPSPRRSTLPPPSAPGTPSPTPRSACLPARRPGRSPGPRDRRCSCGPRANASCPSSGSRPSPGRPTPTGVYRTGILRSRSHLREGAFAQTLDELLYLLLTPAQGHGVGLRDHHRVGTTPLLQPHPEGVGPPVERVREHPPGGHVGREGPLQHLLGQLYLVAEDEPRGDAALRAS